MTSFRNWFPVVTALISALALLGGYVLQKSAERDAETRKTRQEIYSRLISNITERNTLLGRYEETSEFLNAKPGERQQLESQFQFKDPALTENEGKRTEIIASLCLYGTDEAIDAYVKYARANAERRGGDLGELVFQLRQSITRTHIKPGDANLAIWQDPKYLEGSSQAR
jgi:hypothetical protein